MPALTQALKAEDEKVAISAAIALGRIGEPVEEAISMLIDALQTKEWHIREEAATALGGVANSVQGIVPVLIGALEDEHKGVRYHALEALLEIDTPEAIKAVEEFRKNTVKK